MRGCDGSDDAQAAAVNASATEREAMRACLAGELPHATGADERRVASASKRLGEAVRRIQYGAAKLREAWREAGKTEMARRNTHERAVKRARGGAA